MGFVKRSSVGARLGSCQYAQGYLYSKPLDAAAAAAWLRRKQQEPPHASSPNGELALFGIAE